MTPSSLLNQLDITAAVTAELGYTTKLLPIRTEQRILPHHIDRVVAIIEASLRQDRTAEPASVVLASKTKGSRPLNMWRLQDRVLYRALTDRLRVKLPEQLQQRGSHADFEAMPYNNELNTYIDCTDITAFYQYVDHDVLADELIAQTGDFHVVTALVELLGQVMGGRVGIPQVHDSSDVLGDTYIDPVRRKLIRAGYDAYCYADDFRVGCSTLGQARAALELCTSAAREIGLVLNDSKTYTYHRDTYAGTLNRRTVAEDSILTSMNLQEAAEMLLHGEYSDTDETLEPDFGQINDTTPSMDDEENSGAAFERNELVGGVWQVWENFPEHHRSQTFRQLLGEALPVLGSLGDVRPMNRLEDLLDAAPNLTPKIAAYLANLATRNSLDRSSVDRRMFGLVKSDRLSEWQMIWLAFAAASLQPNPFLAPVTSQMAEWLGDCVQTGSHILAAYAADALGQLKVGDGAVLAAARDRVTPEHRLPIMWALGRIDAELAETIADNGLERLMLPAQP